MGVEHKFYHALHGKSEGRLGMFWVDSLGQQWKIEGLRVRESLQKKSEMEENEEV